MSVAVSLLELDGQTRRMVLAPPDIKDEHLAGVIEDAEIDCVVTDRPDRYSEFGIPTLPPAATAPRKDASKRARSHATEWVMLTSGTTGRPKLVVHTLATLTNAIAPESPGAPRKVWATFYDIRRYGGLQMFLRAVLGGCDFVMSDADEPFAEHLARLTAAGVTSISGTPSHWRRVLMSPDRGDFSPSYIRLSGERADQGVLDGLHAAFPRAQISHAYASTEAGVVFTIDDGLAGFPTYILRRPQNGVELKIVDDTLRIRSPKGCAIRYLGLNAQPLMDDEGFIDSGDYVEQRGDRFHFLGRKGGVINIGGLKVHPEEVEDVLNTHPAVKLSLVKARSNAFTGAIVVAELQLRAPPADGEALKRDISDFCLTRLERHKVPAIIHFVDEIGLSAAGKISRA
jgi:acyl-CoA synthetase (AMP-forming)/AMP-acid ligase II